MEIQLNGEAREIPEHSTAHDLVDILGLAGKRMAMEVNQEIVPRTTYHDYRLKPGDQVEIVQAIGGG